MPSLDPKVRKAIRYRYYQSRWPIKRIMETFDVCRQTVYNHISERRGHNPLKFGKEELDVLATMNYRGYTDKAIADKLGVTRSAVTKQRYKLGLKAIPAKQRRKARSTW